MSSPFPFELLLAFAFMGIFMWLGVFLRGLLPFLQKLLVPSSITGGILGMIAFNLGWLPVSAEMFNFIAYHLFIISFISIGLSSAESAPGQNVAKQILQGSGWMAIVNTFSMSTQILLGLGCAALLGYAGYELHPNFGYLLSLGFTQGPGQALNFGKIWEAQAGFANGVNLALTFASLGFFFAFFLGVPLAYWGMKKGITAQGGGKLPDYVLRGYHKVGEQQEVAGHLPVHSGNLDALAFQFGGIGIVYGITYLIYYLISLSAGPIGAGWGFFFAAALFVAIIMQFIMRRLHIGHLLDPGLQRRVSGWAVDYLILATIFPISLLVVWDYIVPITVIAVAGGLWTLGFGYYFGRRMSPLGFERMLAMYGANTGTMASGLILLRIVDPGFKTTVEMECGSYVALVFPTITACLAVMVYAPIWGWSTYAVYGFFVAIALLCLALLKALGMWKKPVY